MVKPIPIRSVWWKKMREIFVWISLRQAGTVREPELRAKIITREN